jgi:glyoxalase/bleomycin resistance protein/dioxygenase superfamily protein
VHRAFTAPGVGGGVTDRDGAVVAHRVGDREQDHGLRRGRCFVADFVTEPTTMPWGNRTLLFRDPGGNLVNFFTPVTPAAIAKFTR